MKQKNHSNKMNQSQVVDFLQKHKKIVLYLMFVIFIVGIIFNSYHLFFKSSQKNKPIYKNEKQEDSIPDDLLFDNIGNDNYLKAYIIYKELKDTASLTPEKAKQLEKEIDKLLQDDH